MRSSRKQVYSSIAAVLSFGSMAAAHAGISMDVSSPQPTLYAQEINIDGTTSTLKSPGTASGGDFGVLVQSGWGVAASSHLYYRFDLGNAKFSSTLTPSNLQVLSNSSVSGIASAANYTATSTVETSGNYTASNVQISQSSGSYVIFDATAGSSGINISDYVYFALGGTSASVTSGLSIVPASKGDITLTFRAFSSTTDALNGTNALKTKTVTIAKFTPYLAFGTSSSPGTVSISAQNNFGQFDTATTSAATGDNQLANLGYFWAVPASTATSGTSAIYSASGTALSAISGVIVPSGSYLSVVGGFGTAAGLTAGTSAAATSGTGVFISTTGDCSTVASTSYVLTPVASSASSATIASVKFDLTNIPSGTGLGSSGTAGAYICYRDTSGTGQSIQEGSYTLQLVATAASGYTAQSYTASSLATFKRAGTTLQASFVAGTSVAGGSLGGVNRFIFTNTGSNAATIVGATLLSGDGTAATSAGTTLTIPTSASTIPANGILAIEAASVIPSTITKRSSVVFTLGAAPDSIKGTYQLLMPGAATQTVVQMVPASQSK